MPAMRLLRLLTIFSVLLAPLTMVGGHVALAAPGAGSMAAQRTHAMPASHCSEMNGPADDRSDHHPRSSIDCTIACAALPSIGSVLADQATMASMAQSLPLARGPTGLNPESDPPPPRFA